MFGRDADAGVGNHEGNSIVSELPRAETVTLSAGGELQRIRDQIAQNLRDLAFIRMQRRQDRPASSKIRSTELLSASKRLQHALQCAEEFLHLESAWGES